MSYFATQTHQIFYIFHRQHFSRFNAESQTLLAFNKHKQSVTSSLFHPSRCSTISRLSRPTWQSRNSTLTPAAFASASAVPNSGYVPTFGLTSVMPSIWITKATVHRYPARCAWASSCKCFTPRSVGASGK